VLIVCRGGGSLEDLWAFNDERVVRAIAASPLPVLCGVGHETDFTLADFAADLRAPTPTAAAEMVSPTQEACMADLAATAAAITRGLHRTLDVQAQRLDRADLRLKRPSQALGANVRLLASLQQRMAASAMSSVRRNELRNLEATAALRRGVHVFLAVHQRRLAQAQGHLRGLDPRQVLQRGYAWVTDERGHALSSTASLAIGQRIVAVLADGQAVARIDEIVRSMPSAKKE
jgi:exodeoxyribonuclease VII large subunit